MLFLKPFLFLKYVNDYKEDFVEQIIELFPNISDLVSDDVMLFPDFSDMFQSSL